jgi:hypothetical protein
LNNTYCGNLPFKYRSGGLADKKAHRVLHVITVDGFYHAFITQTQIKPIATGKPARQECLDQYLRCAQRSIHHGALHMLLAIVSPQPGPHWDPARDQGALFERLENVRQVFSCDPGSVIDNISSKYIAFNGHAHADILAAWDERAGTI